MLILALGVSVAGGYLYQGGQSITRLAPSGLVRPALDLPHAGQQVAARGSGASRRAALGVGYASPVGLAIERLVPSKQRVQEQASEGFHFAPPTAYRLGVGDAYAVAIGDVTGDGRQDVVVTNVTVPEFSAAFVYIQGVDGKLMAPISFKYKGINGDRAPVVIGDVNRDGIGDIVIAHQGGITIALGGKGTFSPVEIASDLRFMQVAVIDLDLDGVQDIVAQSFGDDAAFFYSDGLGGVRKVVYRDTLSTGYDDLKIGDVTGDGLADMVQTSMSYNFRVLRHNGVDGFDATRVYSWPENMTADGLAIGDFTGDGLNDVAITATLRDPTNGIQHGLRIFRGTVEGSFETQEFQPLTGSPEQILTTDLDSDGRADLLMLDGYSLRYLLQREGTFPEETFIGVGNAIGFESGRLASGDLNGDGCPDVAVASISDGLVVLEGANCSDRRSHRTDGPLRPQSKVKPAS